MEGVFHALIILALCLLAGIPPVLAAESLPSSEDCLACHADRSLKRSAPAPGRSGSVFVDAAALQASAHRGLACVACHTSASVPHEEHLPPVRCETCHRAPHQQVRGSVHARLGGPGPSANCIACHGTHHIRPVRGEGAALCASCHAGEARQMAASVHAHSRERGGENLPTCTSCHTAHAVKSPRDPTSPTSRAHSHETCAACHANPKVVGEGGILQPRVVILFEHSIHGLAIREGNLSAATCTDCHGAHEIRRPDDPGSPVFKRNVAETCGQCHAGEAQEYLASIHGRAVEQGVWEAPTCTDCHGEHGIPATRAPGSRVAPLTVSKTCAACHAATPLIQEFGLPARRVETFFGSFHGLAIQEGSPVVANCASCHGTHNIFPSSDPRSTINPRNLPRTCGKCHPGAGPQLASVKIHVAPGFGENPWVTLARRMYLVIILVTIGGMSVHNGLDFLARLRERRRAELLGELAEPAVAPALARRLFERLTRGERLQHQILFVSFTILAITGFALKFPESWWARPLVAIEGGYAIRAWVHRVAGVALTLAALCHVGYMLGTPRGRSQCLAMWPRWQDVRDAWDMLGFNLGLRQARPRFHRFSYAEKLEYWAVIWGTAVMAATGYLMWLQSLVLRRWPLWSIDLATVIHYYEAWLAVLAILIWHFYHVIFRPDVYPMSRVWLSGKLTGREMAEEHPAELDQILVAEHEAERLAEDEQARGVPERRAPASAPENPEPLSPGEGPQQSSASENGGSRSP